MSSSPTTVSYSAMLEPSSVNNITLDTGQTGTIAATTSGTVSCTTTSSNEIIFVGVALVGAVTVSSITDTRSLTWRKVVACSNSTSLRGELWWALEPTAQTHTITVTLSASGTTGIVAGAFKQYNSALPFDPSSITSGLGSSTVPTSTSYTVNPCSTLIGFVAFLGGSGSTVSVGSGFTTVANVNQSTNVGAAMEYQKLTTASTTNTINYTLGTSEVWVQLGCAIMSAGQTTTTTGGNTVNGNVLLIQAPGTTQEFVLKNIFYGGPVCIAKWDSTNPIMVLNSGTNGNQTFQAYQDTSTNPTAALLSYYVVLNTSATLVIDVGYEGTRSQ